VEKTVLFSDQKPPGPPGKGKGKDRRKAWWQEKKDSKKAGNGFQQKKQNEQQKQNYQKVKPGNHLKQKKTCSICGSDTHLWAQCDKFKNVIAKLGAES
jgi:hypothetical protein